MTYASYDRPEHAGPTCERCKVAPVFGRHACADHRRRAALADRDPRAIAELDRDLERLSCDLDRDRHEAERAEYLRAHRAMRGARS